MVKKEDSDYESPESVSSSSDNAVDDDVSEEYGTGGEEEDDVDADADEIAGISMNTKRVRVRKTDDGEDIKMLRLKLEDRKFTGNCVRQANAILYVASVINARNAFYSNMWNNMSQILRNCTKNMESWTLQLKQSDNISHWLNTESIEFCVLHEPFAPVKLESKNSCTSSATSSKPIGRPRKSVDELKFRRSSRYQKKNSVFVDNGVIDAVDEEKNLNCVKFPGMKSMQRIPIFEAKRFQFDVSIMNINGIDGGLRVKDLSTQMLNLFQSTSSDVDYSTLGDELPRRLPKIFFDELKKEAKKPLYFQALFCGGPISAIALCPRRSSTGDEIVAISTFPDEKLLSSLDNTAHIQFWAFPSDLSSPAKLLFILEIPDVSAVLCLKWCPCFTNDFYSSNKSNRSKSATNKQKNQGWNYFEETQHVLGFLSVATNVGKILIYCIPKDLDELIDTARSNNNSTSKSKRTTKLANGRLSKGGDQASSVPNLSSFPVVLTTKPKLILNHSTAAMRIDEGNQEIFFKKVAKKAKNAHEASASVVQSIQNLSTADVLKELNEFPILNMSWSPFRNGRMIAAVSAAGRVLIWDLEKESTFNDPLIIYSTVWSSPPIAVDWFTECNVCVSFRHKCVRVFNVDTLSCSFKEDTSKSSGQMVVSCPPIFPGFFVYDTHYLPFLDIFFSCLSYITFPEIHHKSALLVPTLNAHQIQVTRANVSEISGCVTSVGADGRLVTTLNGRIISHNGDKSSIFYMGRTNIHIVPHRKKDLTLDALLATYGDEVTTEDENKSTKSSPSSAKKRKVVKSSSSVVPKKKQKGNVKTESELDKLCFTHADCCENKWLEIRLCDATLQEHLTMRRMKTKISDVSLDRRLESLTYVDNSHVTPSLSVSGGEAGLIFIMPCIL